jgi:hypothetical protein
MIYTTVTFTFQIPANVYILVFVVFSISCSNIVSLYDDHFEVCVYCKGKTFHILVPLKLYFDSQIMLAGCQNSTVAILKTGDK